MTHILLKFFFKSVCLLILSCNANAAEQINLDDFPDYLSTNVNDIFYKSSYTLDGTAYISERILFPATINGQNLKLEMKVDRPGDDKTYPVLILTHGRNGPFPERNIYTSKCFDNVKERFLKQHLIVVQLVRRGAGLSEGSNMDEYQETPIESGMEMVKDIEQALIYMKTKPYVDKNKFVIGGHSQGGWAALATASANLEGVTCVINFSGATNYRKQPSGEDWHRKASIDFIRDCKILAKKTQVPSLWIYGESEPLHNISDLTKCASFLRK